MQPLKDTNDNMNDVIMVVHHQQTEVCVYLTYILDISIYILY